MTTTAISALAILVQLDGFGPVGRRQGAIPGTAQGQLREVANQRLIIHDEDAFAATWRQGRRRGGGRLGGDGGRVGRQKNLEHTAVARFAAALDEAAMVLDDGKAGGQPQAVPLPSSLVVKNGSKIWA